MAHLTIRLLGNFQLIYNDNAIVIPQVRQQSLLSYLVLHHHAPQTRQHLAFRFWPDSSEAQARANLRQALHHLRHTLPHADDYLHLDAQQVQWLPKAPVTVDLFAFAEQLRLAESANQPGQHTHVGNALQSAVDCYQGDLLPDCYDEWIFPLREEWRARFINALDRLIQCWEGVHEYGSAIAAAQRLLRHDPLHESTYRHLMRLYALNGEQASALRTYHTCVTLLQRELGVEPHPTTQETYASLLNLELKPTAAVRSGLATSSLVGRQVEWSKLQTAWQRTTSGSRHFALISGEAGIGKSRLVEELLHWSRQRGIRVAYTRCYAAEGTLAYSPVIDWLRSEAFQAELPNLESVWLTEIARLLPELLVQHPKLQRPEALDEHWQRQRLFEALARAFTVSKQTPLLAIDDLQWCDPETLAWLHYLLRYNPKLPLFVVGTVRAEEIGEKHALTALLPLLRREDQVTEIALAPLTVAESKTLAVQTAGQELDSATLERLVQFSEGNPLFVVETMRVQSSVWSASLRQAAENAPKVARQVLPPKVQAVIEHRLQQISPTAREIANLAAVSGRSFTFALLAHASELHDEKVVAGLDELWQRRLIREQGLNAYDFSHDRIREVAYALISPVRRRLLHSQIAEALQRLHQDDLNEISAVLASHYEQGGMVEPAIAWYQRAATVAERRFVYASAVDYVDAALRLLLTLPQTTERIKEQLALLLAKEEQLAPVYGLVSQERTNVYNQVAAIVNLVADDRLRFIARCRLRGFYGLSGHMAEAYQQAEQLLALAHQLDKPLFYMDADQGYSMVNFQLGRFLIAKHFWSQAEERYTTQLSPAERGEYGPITGRMGLLALTLWLLGYPDQARHKMAAVVAQVEINADPLAASFSLFFADLLYRHMGEVTLLMNIQQQLSRLATHYAIWTTKLENRSLQEWLAVQQGDFAQSTGQMRMEIDALKKAGHTMFQTHRLGLLIEAQLKASQLAATAATLDEAFAMSEQAGQRSFDAELHRLRGEWLVQSSASSQEATAEAAFWLAIELARSQEAKSFELRSVTSLCRLWQRQGKRREAHQLLAAIYGWFTEGFDTADLQAAKTLLDELA